MDLSIIIVNFETKELTKKCLDSIFKSKPKAECEIILIDNGSQDDSASALTEYIQTRKKQTIQISLIENQENLGFARANNQGIKQAKGKHVLLLNSDAEVKPKAIDRLLIFSQKKPGVGAVTAKLLNPDGSVQGSVFRFPTISRAIRQYWFGQRILDKYSPAGKEPRVIEAVAMTAFLITAQALKKIGLLNESYFMYFEDLDYCRRLKEAGLKVYFLPQAEVVHYHGASGRELADFANQWRRLIPSSKIYHGLFGHYLFNFILWSSQKWQKFFQKR